MTVTAVVGVQRENPGRLRETADGELATLVRAGAVGRLWARDVGLWPADETGRREIADRMGWLDSPQWLAAHTSEIEEFGREVIAAGFARIVLLGMGGSSLAPEVLEQVVGVAPGNPPFSVLDSTDPEAVAHVDQSIDPRRTLFIVASKSGGTIETLSHYRFFRSRVDSVRPADAARSFVAITDGGSGLDRLATSQAFRRIFRNPADIGGRYSALSYFGMVPGGLMGQDLGAYARNAAAMAETLHAEEGTENPALRLGALIGAAALKGADKLTLLTSDRLRPLGYWIEQLVAESTGKNGRGIVPIEGEPRGRVSDYGTDRCFVVVRQAGAGEPELMELVAQLERSGHPLVDIELPNVSAIAGEFLRWGVAVALAGAVLAINPFDQPNVQESKDRTTSILTGDGGREPRQLEPKGNQPSRAPRLRIGAQVELHAGEGTWSRVGRPQAAAAQEAEPAIEAFLDLARPGEYLVLLTYMARTEWREEWLRGIRRTLRDATRMPVLQGYGPRFLHSIGQLYKGGPPTGLFIQITHAPRDLPIPDSPWSFGVLEAAQAQGDLEALEVRGKPALRFHLIGEVDEGLKVVGEILSNAAARAARTIATLDA